MRMYQHKIQKRCKEDHFVNTRECEQSRSYPFSACGKVFMGQGWCSGSHVGEGIIMLAGHCVSDGRGNFGRQFTFCPGYNSGCPAQFHAVRVITFREYHNGGDFAKDIAFLRVQGNPGQGLNIIANHNRAMMVDAVGYPNNIGGGQRMICTSNPMAEGNRQHKPVSVQLRSAMTQGSSGGPWIANRNGVASLVSHGMPG